MPAFGGHISFGKDLLSTIRSLVLLEGNVLQMFVGNPYSCWTPAKTKEYYDKVSPKVRSLCHELGVQLFIHAPYTLNFAKNPHEEKAYWIDALVAELKIADMIGAKGCVLHMGKAVKQNMDTALEYFHDNLDCLISKLKSEGVGAKVIVETSAGQGTELYATDDDTLDNLAMFFARFTADQRDHIALCVDTCHIFAAGYDIRTIDQVHRFFHEFDDKIGIEYLAVVHLNNSTKGLGCGVDRHECLQYGQIPYDALCEFAKMCFRYDIPIVLETPGAMYEIPVLARIAHQNV